MTRITAWIVTLTSSIGGFGIFVIALLDSSFLSFPAINDATIISMVVARPERMIFYASMATIGSVAGCLMLYVVGRKGGEALLRKRFNPRNVEWATGIVRKYGALALVVPALLPPPMPFKIFVLLAGVAGVPLYTFAISIALGRGVRYFGEGILAVFWGEAALNYVQQNGRMVGLVLGIAVLLVGTAYLVWKRRRAQAEAF
jgi:membrane protein YqaA with SNARE-associated domain